MAGVGGGRWPSRPEREVGERPPVVCRLACSLGDGGEELHDVAGSVGMEVDLRGLDAVGPEGGGRRPLDAGDALRARMEVAAASTCMAEAELFCRARMGLPEVDVCMDGAMEGQNTVAGASLSAAGADGCPLVYSMHEGSAMEEGEVGNDLNAALFLEKDVLRSDTVNKVGLAQSLPLNGRFSLGSRQEFGSARNSCMQGVRSYVSTRDSVLGSSGAGPGSPQVQVNQPMSAWNRPVSVLLPGRKDLGMEASNDGRVQLDVDEVLSTVKRFDMALVGRLFGRKLSFEFLDSELHRRWNGFGKFRLVTLSGNCFMCFFDNLESRDAVLLGGPWIVAGQVVGVDSWSPSFSPSSHAGFVTPVWVRIPGLPLYCWGARNIARIVCQLGEPVSMDAATDRLERGQFARVCVRLDLSKPLLPGMWIDGPYGSFFQSVEYEGLSSFCFLCGHVGHKSNWCRNKPGVRDPPAGVVAHEELGKHGAGAAASKGGDSLQVDLDVAGGSVKPKDYGVAEPSGEEVADSPVGLGPWMLVSRKKNSPRGLADRRNKGKGVVTPSAKQNQYARKKQENPPNSSWEKFPHDSKKVFGSDHVSGSPVSSMPKSHLVQPELSPSQVCSDSRQAEFSGFNSISRSQAYVDRELGNLGPVTHGSRIKRRRQVILNDGGVASPVAQE